MTALYAYICRISLRHIKCLLYGWVPSKLLIHTVYTYVNLYKNDYVSQLLDRKNDHFIARIRTFWTWIFIKNMIRFMYIQIKLVLPTFRIEKFLLRFSQNMANLVHFGKIRELWPFTTFLFLNWLDRLKAQMKDLLFLYVTHTTLTGCGHRKWPENVSRRWSRNYIESDNIEKLFFVQKILWLLGFIHVV